MSMSSCVAAHFVSWTSRSFLLVNLLHDRVELCLDLLLLGFVICAVSVYATLEELQSFIDDTFDSLLFFLGELVLQLLVTQCVLDLEAIILKAILGINLFAGLLVLFLVALSVLDHLLDLLGTESVCVGLDLNRLRFTVCFVDCLDVENAVSVDIEGDFNLRSASWGRLYSFKVELAKLVIVLNHWPFSFKDFNLHSWLVVSVGRESLRFLAWNLRVSWNDVSHDASSGLNSLRKRSDVDKQYILKSIVISSIFIAKDGCLNSSTVSNCFIRVDRLVQCLPIEEFREHGLNFWDSG